MFCPGWQKWHGMFCQGRHVLSGVTKTTWGVLSRVANRCGVFCSGMFCPTFSSVGRLLKDYFF